MKRVLEVLLNAVKWTVETTIGLVFLLFLVFAGYVLLNTTCVDVPGADTRCVFTDTREIPLPGKE